MYRVVNGNADQSPDVHDFIDLLNTLDDHPFAPAPDLFQVRSDLIVTRAPGRLDLMGGIADYSGSHVLQFPIAEATFAAVQLSASRHLHIVTLLEGEESTVSIPIDLLGTFKYDAAREFFSESLGCVRGGCVSSADARTECKFRVWREYFDLVARAAGKRRELIRGIGSSCDAGRHGGV
jgi:galactokinase